MVVVFVGEFNEMQLDREGKIIEKHTSRCYKYLTPECVNEKYRILRFTTIIEDMKRV